MTKKKTMAKKVYRKPTVAKKETSHVCSGACGTMPGICGALVVYY